MSARKCLSAQFPPDVDPGEALVALLDGAAAFAEEAGLTTGDTQRLAIVVEELASNTARHGAGDGEVSLSLTLIDEGNWLTLTFEDNGAPFDPTTRPVFDGPDPNTGGGVGLELVRAWCVEMAYQRVGSGNRLRLKLPRQRRD